MDLSFGDGDVTEIGVGSPAGFTHVFALDISRKKGGFDGFDVLLQGSTILMRLKIFLMGQTAILEILLPDFQFSFRFEFRKKFCDKNLGAGAFAIFDFMAISPASVAIEGLVRRFVFIKSRSAASV